MKALLNPPAVKNYILPILMLALFFASCNNNCTDYLLIPEVRRFNPYQLNQQVVFQNTNQQRDTFVITQYQDTVLTEICVNNSNHTFQYEELFIRLESITTDSLLFRMGATNNTFAYLGFGECCNTDVSWDAAVDTVHLSLDAANFSFAQSEVVNGHTYPDVATFTPQYFSDRKCNSAKVAIDEGLIAYQDLTGMWWYRL